MSANSHEKDVQDPSSLESKAERSNIILTQCNRETPVQSDGDVPVVPNGSQSGVFDAATPSKVEGDAIEEPPSERPIARVVSGEEYSVLSVMQKKIVVLTVSFAALFSPMATSIYCMVFHDTICF